MPRPGRDRDRLAGISRVILDGRNIQHVLARGTRGGDLPDAALIARLRAAFPVGLKTELVLDGHPAGGPMGRLAPGLDVRYTGARSADDVIAYEVDGVLQRLGPGLAWSVLVVSDDREVREHARRRGVQVEATAWLSDRVSRGAAPRDHRGGRPAAGTSIGHARPPRSARGRSNRDDC